MSHQLPQNNPHAASHIRVLYLVDTLNLGGTETQVVQTALHMRRSGHDVTVGCLSIEGPLLRNLQEAQIPVLEFSKGRTLLSVNGFWQLARLSVFLRRKKFQVLHAYDLWANLLGIPAAWLARTPVRIASRRYLTDLDWYRPWRRKVISLIYKLATHIVVNASVVRDLLVQRDGVADERIRILYNGVDIDRFALAHQRKRPPFDATSESAKFIAVVANFYPAKGHACLITAATHICRRFPETIFVLIGDGKERARLEKQVRRAGLERNFLFLGYRQDVSELLSCCDMSVLPSETEATSNALLEAMAAGLPVVATRVGGASEIIEDGINGLLVAPRDPAALAAAILRLLSDAAFAQPLGRAAQNKIQSEFAFDRLSRELEELYRERSHKHPSEAVPVPTSNFAEKDSLLHQGHCQ